MKTKRKIFHKLNIVNFLNALLIDLSVRQECEKNATLEQTISESSDEKMSSKKNFNIISFFIVAYNKFICYKHIHIHKLNF
ncbi:MAG: hypothetical protein CK425_01205 [Parachlamydia sp.]|jgi:hypothetical protein|nr:MAG: hypothetical protein CK425_01205 [Parachlamydia sp.]